MLQINILWCFIFSHSADNSFWYLRDLRAFRVGCLRINHLRRNHHSAKTMNSVLMKHWGYNKPLVRLQFSTISSDVESHRKHNQCFYCVAYKNIWNILHVMHKIYVLPLFYGIPLFSFSEKQTYWMKVQNVYTFTDEPLIAYLKNHTKHRLMQNNQNVYQLENVKDSCRNYWRFISENNLSSGAKAYFRADYVFISKGHQPSGKSVCNVKRPCKRQWKQ